MNSSEYKAKIDEFMTLKGQLMSLSGVTDSSASAVAKSREYLDEIIICGEPIDKGVLSGNVTTLVENIADTIDQLIRECQVKIDEYTDLYNAALKAEQEAREREEKKANRWWSKWI